MNDLLDNYCFQPVAVEATGVCGVAIGNPERHVRKASHCGSKQQWRSCAATTLSLLVRATYTVHGVVRRAHPVRGESHIQRHANGEAATMASPLTLV